MEHIDRRSFLDGAVRFAVGGLAAGAIVETAWPDDAWARQVAKETHPASARVLNRLRTRFTFQISVDVDNLAQGLRRGRCGAGGRGDAGRNGHAAAQIQGVANVVPAFRRHFPDALLLADMKTMDGGGFEARAGLCRRRQHHRFPRRSPARLRRRPSAPCATSSAATAPNCRGSPSPTFSCRTRVRPRRPLRSPSACSTPASTASASTCSRRAARRPSSS